MRAADVAPAHWHLGDRPTEETGPGQQLDIEGEALDAREVEQELCLCGPESLEAALGVAKVDRAEQPHKAVEAPSSNRANSAAVVDVTSNSTAADGERGVVEGSCDRRDLARVDGKVGVGEDQPRSCRGGDAAPHRRTLATVGGLAEDPGVGQSVGELGGTGCGVVARAVIHVEQLEPTEVETPVLAGALQASEAGRESISLVVSRDDEAEIRGSHRTLLHDRLRPSGRQGRTAPIRSVVNSGPYPTGSPVWEAAMTVLVP